MLYWVLIGAYNPKLRPTHSPPLLFSQVKRTTGRPVAAAAVPPMARGLHGSVKMSANAEYSEVEPDAAYDAILPDDGPPNPLDRPMLCKSMA